MFRQLHFKFRGLPTPMAGLALGVASLGWCMENALPLQGFGQLTGAVIASCLLMLLVVRFAFHADTLVNDLRHPVLGSIVPTFAMAVMVISRALHDFVPTFSIVLWCLAVAAHLAALVAFLGYRSREAVMGNMVPSWFIPPVGIIVADVSFPGIPSLEWLADGLLIIGMSAYAVMLPMMMYRFIFHPEVPNAAKPTIAIMAAPASLSLAGYLTVIQEPSLLLVAILLGIALLMTIAIYFCFFKLLRLQFSPGYAAYTFPMAIGATALYKTANLVASFEGGAHYAEQIRMIAHAELIVATLVIGYVFVLYMVNLKTFMSVQVPGAKPALKG